MHSIIFKNLSLSLFTIALGSLGLVSCDTSSSTAPVYTAAESSALASSSSIQYLGSSTINISSSLATSFAQSSSSFSYSSKDSVWFSSYCYGTGQKVGYWYKFDDHAETLDNGPGASTSTFPDTGLGSGTLLQSLDEMIDVTFSINPTTYKYPYAGIGFNWTNPAVISAQNWSQICVMYTLSGDVPVQMELRNDPALDGGNPFRYTLPPQAQLTFTCFDVAKFSQESGWGTKLNIATAMENSLGIRFTALLKSPPAVVKTAHLIITEII